MSTLFALPAPWRRDAKLLLQQRAASKYHCPGKWANTCCTHPHWGETVEDAASRRIREELGFSLPLSGTTVIDYRADVGNGLVENERVHVFEGHADHSELAILPNEDEVAAVKWLEVAELRELQSTRPGTLCPWFSIYISRWDELKLLQ